MIDFHSHILPGIDDGANDIEESLALLRSLREQGVTTVVATPHYISNCSIKSFLKKRQDAYDELYAAMDKTGEEFPNIVLGAEVAVNEYLMEHHDLERLCIEGTKVLLAEMPNKFWEPFLYHILYTIRARYHLDIMIAHVDRYFSSLGRNSKILKLIDMQPYFQINAPSLKLGKGKKLLKMLTLLDCKFVFGSDCHDSVTRRPYIKEPLEYISKKYGNEYIEDVNELGKKLLKYKI